MKPLRLARASAIALWLLMVALTASWPAWTAGARTPFVIGAVAVAVIVLLLPLRGLWKGRRRTYGLASLVIVPYVGFGAMEVVANPAVRLPAAALMFVGLASMASLVVYLRISRGAEDAGSPG